MSNQQVVTLLRSREREHGAGATSDLYEIRPQRCNVLRVVAQSSPCPRRIQLQEYLSHAQQSIPVGNVVSKVFGP